jgi:hypothetical protein
MRYDDSNYTLLIKPVPTIDGMPEAMPRVSPYGSRMASGFGLVPLLDFPSKLVRPDEIEGVIKECHEKKIFAMYHQEATWAPEGFEWYQNGLPWCWTWGITAAVQDVEASEGRPTIPLAPNTNGWLVGWQQRGYFLDATIAGVKDRGIAPASFVPHLLETNPRKFKEGWEQAALDHRVDEWWDTKRETDIGMICQALSILRTGKSCYIAYNWWGHALSCCGMFWNPSGFLNVDWVNRNSHKEKKWIVMGGRKAIPDELYGVRAIAV